MWRLLAPRDGGSTIHRRVAAVRARATRVVPGPGPVSFMNDRLREISAWRREATRREPARVKGRNGPGLAIRERTRGFDPVREESDPVLVRDELWSILNRIPREQASLLERVYLLGGSIAAEGKTRVYRARLAARGA